ncbi:hypothetical protein [Oceanicola sp. D3]|nr:hypothetical protein [Oceanicola sp. D3]
MMTKTRISLIALAFAALSACSPAPADLVTVQQFDASAVVWSTGSYR